MNIQKNIKNLRKARRKARVRVKVSGTNKKPRLSVARSLKHVSAQLIDDQAGKTLVAASDWEIKVGKDQKKVDRAFKVGELLAQKALAAKIETVVFDRAGFRFHGRVKALAEGARKGGLKF